MRGLRVPQDVMLATRYDGLRARTCEPPLTAVNLHLEEVARQAIELLLAHSAGYVELFYGSPLNQASWELATDALARSKSGVLVGGAPAPDFEALSQDGRKIALSSLRQQGPVMLVFLRGFG